MPCGCSKVNSLRRYTNKAVAVSQLQESLHGQRAGIFVAGRRVPIQGAGAGTSGGGGVLRQTVPGRTWEKRYGRRTGIGCCCGAGALYGFRFPERFVRSGARRAAGCRNRTALLEGLAFKPLRRFGAVVWGVAAVRNTFRREKFWGYLRAVRPDIFRAEGQGLYRRQSTAG